jgi:hypothetical protein
MSHKSIPSFHLHRSSGQAVVTIDGHEQTQHPVPPLDLRSSSRHLVINWAHHLPSLQEGRNSPLDANPAPALALPVFEKKSA